MKQISNVQCEIIGKATNPEKIKLTIPPFNAKDLDDAEYYLPFKELSSGVVAFLDISGKFTLIERCADHFERYIRNKNNKFPDFDVIVNPVSKSNALAHALASRLHALYSYTRLYPQLNTVVARSGNVPNGSLSIQYKSVTTTTEKTLYLVDEDIASLKNKKVLLLDDVYAAGGTLGACRQLVESAGGTVVSTMVIAIEEGCKPIDDLYYLFELPLLK